MPVFAIVKTPSGEDVLKVDQSKVPKRVQEEFALRANGLSHAYPVKAGDIFSPRNLKLVAIVNTNSMQEAWDLTAIGGWTNPAVKIIGNSKKIGRFPRTTTMGDVLVTPDGKKYVVDLVGFTPLSKYFEEATYYDDSPAAKADYETLTKNIKAARLKDEKHSKKR